MECFLAVLGAGACFWAVVFAIDAHEDRKRRKREIALRALRDDWQKRLDERDRSRRH